MNKLAEIFALKPEDEKRLHPYALKCLRDWTENLVREVPPLGQLEIDEINADVNTYLNDDEKARATKYTANVTAWLLKCMGIGNGYSPYPYSNWVFDSMYELKRLVKTAYERKQTKAEEERKKRAEEAKRSDAYAALKVPADAEKYLNSGEYQDFTESIPGALDAYVSGGESCHEDSRVIQYSFFRDRIEYRRREEQNKIAAARKAATYNRSLNTEILRIRSLLRQRRQNPEKLFEKDAADTRYTGQSFSRLLSKEEEKDFDRKIVDAGKKKVDEIVSGDFHKFIDGEYAKTYFLLPWADYIVEGVPCLGFGFDVFAVVEVRVWLKPGRNNFDGYPFDLPWREGKGWSVSLRKREFLGYHYFVLTPEELGYSFWRDIPLSLVIGLMTGDKEPPGTDILQASDSETTYSVAGFDEKVTIPEVFASYLRKMEGVDGMFGLGVISSRVADVVDKKLAELNPNENGASNRHSKKIGFEDAELVAALANLGISTAEAGVVVPLVPRDLELKEAVKVAMKKLAEISSQKSNEKRG